VIPQAGSEPKKVLEHSPLSVTVLCTQRTSAPYRTVWVPVTENDVHSMAIFTQLRRSLGGAGAGAGAFVELTSTSHSLRTPGTGSLPKNALVHSPDSVTDRRIQVLPDP